jgi:hypothetical protein
MQSISLSKRTANQTRKTLVQTTSSRIKAKDLMINKTAEKGTKNVAIMTKEASELADDFKKKLPAQSSRHSANIHRINE